MSGVRLFIGVVVMGVAVPVTLFLLLDLHTIGGFVTIAATTLFSWGVADLLASILERPRLSGRSPVAAIREHSSHLTGDATAEASRRETPEEKRPT